MSLDGGRSSSWLGTRGLGAVHFGRLLSCGKYLVIVPGLVVLLQGPIEGGKLALDNELVDDSLIPVAGPRVDPLRGEIPEIDGVLVVAAAGRGTVAHGWKGWEPTERDVVVEGEGDKPVPGVTTGMQAVVTGQ